MRVLHLQHACFILLAHCIAKEHRTEHTVAIAVADHLVCEWRLHDLFTLVLAVRIRVRVKETFTLGAAVMVANLQLCRIVLLSLGHLSDDRLLYVKKIAQFISGLCTHLAGSCGRCVLPLFLLLDHCAHDTVQVEVNELLVCREQLEAGTCIN